MNDNKIGNRVGAIMGGDKSTKTIRVFGYGVYVGDFVPVDGVGGYAKIERLLNAENPKIQLDNGEHVYGCECWWGAEEVVKRRIEKWIKDGWKIEHVLPSVIRAEYNADGEEL